MSRNDCRGYLRLSRNSAYSLVLERRVQLRRSFDLANRTQLPKTSCPSRLHFKDHELCDSLYLWVEMAQTPGLSSPRPLGAQAYPMVHRVGLWYVSAFRRNEAMDAEPLKRQSRAWTESNQTSPSSP